MKSPHIVLLGERDLSKKSHQGIEASLALYRRDVDSRLSFDWISTASVTPDSIQETFRDASGIWSTSGSLYESRSGAFLAIQHARMEKKAFLGTCSGFQHALMEFAQNVLSSAVEHQEATPTASDPLISKLSCSLAGAKGKVISTSPELFSSILGAEESIEEFNCNYGINQGLNGIFADSDLAFVAHDELGQVRAFRLRRHPFFVGTLFQPERRALVGELHPVIHAFLKAA
jgi:CTP synthase (UTP-ammonia lyase)